MKQSDKKTLSLFRFIILLVAMASLLPGASLGGVIGDVRDEIMLRQLPGKGQFVVYQRNVTAKDPQFPLEAIQDGYKMIRIYRDMDSYQVEWTWRVTLRNKTAREWIIALDYNLEDGDGILVTASQVLSRKIDPGETLSLEKTDSLSYEEARRVMNSSWDIHLLN